ncbi:MAG TPA: hypothetical protein VIH55_03310, partial [Acidimicrobiia bacterium]
GGTAKQQLSQIRQDARATISDLEDVWEASLPVTTTLPPTPTVTSPTITIPTTTSTTTTTTTTTPGSDNGNQGGAASGAGSNNGNGSGGNGASNGSSGNAGGANQDPNPPSPSPSPSAEIDAPRSTDEIGGTGFELAAQTPYQPFTVQHETITSLLESEDMGATVRMAAMLETVLPPAVVDLVLSPLLILEILLRTIVDGGLTFIGPLTLLGVCALAIFIYDRSSRGRMSLDRV